MWRSLSSSSRDQDYFQSYAHFGIYHEMLIDKEWTESYRDALNDSLTGAKMLNISWVLYMFSGVGVDSSDILHQAMDTLR